MAFINRLGYPVSDTSSVEPGSITPVGEMRDVWSSNPLSFGRFVALGTRNTTVYADLVARPGTDMATMELQGSGRFSRSVDGNTLWNFSGHSRSQFRAECIVDGPLGPTFAALVLTRSRSAVGAGDLNGDVIALSNNRALFVDGESVRFTGFHIVEFKDGALQRIAYGTNATYPARGDWILLPGPDENSFIYLSRNRQLVKGEISEGGIVFTVLENAIYQNLEALTHTNEDDYNKMYGGKLPDGKSLVCWNRVSKILTSGEEEEYNADLGMTLYWPYETYTYDLYLSLLDENGATLDTVALAEGINGSRSTLFAGALDDIITLSDGRALLQVNIENNQTSVGRKAKFVSIVDDKLELSDAPAIFTKTVHWEQLDNASADSIIARVTAWGNVGTKISDAFRPQMEVYRLSGDTMTLLYSADAIGVTQTASYEASFYWLGEWSAAGKTLVFCGRWSPTRTNNSRLIAKWDAGYRAGAAGEQYVGLCGRASDSDGVFGLIAPVGVE